MNMRDHIDIDDLTMFALVLLSEQDREVVKAHVAQCVPCREELLQIRRDLEMYAAATEPVAVPSVARARFLAEVSTHAQAAEDDFKAAHGNVGASAEAAAQPVLVAGGRPTEATALTSTPSTSMRRVLPWLGWAVAAAAILVAFGLRQDRDALRSTLAAEDAQTATLQAEAQRARHILGALTDPSAVRVSLSVPKAPLTPSARATYEPKSGTLLLMASNLAPLAPQKVYELWLIPADGGAPLAAGTFAPDNHGNASLLTPALHGAVAAKAFGVTVEPAGGSATPTVPILLVGSVG